jgi:hypothetical protein
MAGSKDPAVFVLRPASSPRTERLLASAYEVSIQELSPLRIEELANQIPKPRPEATFAIS